MFLYFSIALILRQTTFFMFSEMPKDSPYILFEFTLNMVNYELYVGHMSGEAVAMFKIWLPASLEKEAFILYKYSNSFLVVN